MNRRSLAVLAIVGAAILLLGASVAAAAERLGGKLRFGEVVRVAEGDTVRGDLYAAGERVTIDGTIDGDLIAFASIVEVNGTVTGDLLVGGGNVRVSGEIGGDARIGAGQLSVGGEIAEDLVLFAGQTTVTGVVGEDLIFFSGDVAMDGDVAGDVLGSAGRYDRHGTVGGNEEVTLGRGFDRPEPPEPRDRVADALRTFATVAVLAALLIWLWPQAIVASADAVRRRPLASLGVGVLALIGFVVGAVVALLLAILLAVALGVAGLGPLAGIVAVGGVLLVVVAAFVFVVTAAFVVQSVVGLTLARLAFRDEPATRWVTLGLVIGGAAVVVALSALPAIGPLVGLITVLFGLGGIGLAAWSGIRRSGAPPALAPAPASPPPPPPAP